jgi:thiol-disulfide isomerase/thioredoxin
MSTERNEAQQTEPNGRNPIILIGGLVVLVAAAALLLFGGLFNGGAADTVVSDVQLPTSGGPVFVGDTALDFTLLDLDGTAVTLSDHLGQPIVINFWASWCAPCRIEMPELQALHDKYAADGLVILALNQGEPAHVAANFFISEMGLTFTNPLLDSESEVANKYGLRNLPTTLFIDAEGQVTVIHRGPALFSQFEGYLAETAPELVQ